MENIEVVIQKIKNAFSRGVPNGLLLGWQQNRHYDDIVHIAKPYRVTNDTDFNYSFCNSYNVDFNCDSSNYVYVITLKISFIADVYSIHVTRYTRDKKKGRLIHVFPDAGLSILMQTVHGCMQDKGFVVLKNESLDLELDDLELELAEVATIGKCLFDDFE